MYNIKKAQVINDPGLFKKLGSDLWEFRTKYSKNQYRILAFWDRVMKRETVVVACNGFVKKTAKTPEKELEVARKLRQQYFEKYK